MPFGDARQEQLAARDLLDVGDRRIADGDAGNVLQRQTPLLADPEADGFAVVLGEGGQGEKRKGEQQGSGHAGDATGGRPGCPSDNWRRDQPTRKAATVPAAMEQA